MICGLWVFFKFVVFFGCDQQLFDIFFGWCFINLKMDELYGIDVMGMIVENLVEFYVINCDDQDKFVLWLQQKVMVVQVKGILLEEIVLVVIFCKKQEQLIFDIDEFMCLQIILEGFGNLKLVFKKDGSVMVGNVFGLNDGVVVILMVFENGLKYYYFILLVSVVGVVVVGVELCIMGIGLVEVIKKVLKCIGLMLNDMDVIELNEVFVVQVLVCM